MRTSRAAALAATALGLAVLTAGCSVHPGQAAVVDGHGISEGDLSRAVDELGPLLTDGSDTGVLNALLQARAGLKVGESYDVAVTDAQAREFLDAVAEGAQVASPAWGAESVDVGRAQLMLQALAERGEEGIGEAFQAELADLDITVNPRYGEQDAETGVVGALDLPWIVTPEAAEEPAAQ